MATEMTTDMETAHKRMEKIKAKASQGFESVKKGTGKAMQAPEKVPTNLYLGLAMGSILVSLVLFLVKKKDKALFVGLWPPTFLSLAMFYKLLHPSSETTMTE